jgi:hypothetical protein
MAATKLESELVRLNALVRERRKQLARLKDCPNQQCPCRVVWQEVVERNLASQVGKIQRNVRSKPSPPARSKRRPRKSS